MTILDSKVFKVFAWVAVQFLFYQSAFSEIKVEDWVPSRLQNGEAISVLRAQLAQCVAVSEPIIEDENTLLGFRGATKIRDFGYGFSRIDPIRGMCLTEVKRRYELKGEVRPHVLDVGAGLGHMAWKLIVAGAHYRGVETQMATVKILLENATKAKPFLKLGEKISQVAKVSPFNFLEFREKSKISEPFEVVWMGDVLHFLSPSQFDQSLDDLNSMMISGGEVFASADTPAVLKLMAPDSSQAWLKTEKIGAAFFENKEKGEEFPGSIIVNALVKGSIVFDSKGVVLNYSEGNQQIETVVSTRSLGLGGKQFLPGEAYLGFMGESPKSLFDSLVSRNEVKSGLNTVLNFTSKQRRVFHVFDAVVLKNAFEKHGFKVVDLFYVDPMGQRYEMLEVKQEDFQLRFLKVNIRAQKI